MKSDSYQFVVWGYRNTYHTHGYLHAALYRTLQHMGREVRWLDKDDGLGFEKTIFISINNVAHTLPLVDDALYMIHNFRGGNEVAEEKFKNSNVLHFGVRTDNSGSDTEKAIDIYWGTDLLPHEIEQNKHEAKALNTNSRVVHWVGSIQGGEFSNESELHAFASAAESQGLSFKTWGGFSHATKVSREENVKLIRESYMAPTIVGAWQRRVGYIPERIFKNISYGHYGVTNSEAINRLFGDKLICNHDTKQLFFDAKERLSKISVGQLYDLMDEVAKKHTYINRIDQLLAKAENLL